MRTSKSHPLRLDGLPLGAGRLSLTFCPGKRQPDSLSGGWSRDLDADLDALRAAGVDLVVSLVTDAEMAALGTAGLGEGVRRRGMAWLHLPFPDGTAPDAAWLARWDREASPRLHQALDAGRHVLIHCKGGIERAPTVAALLLLERGDGLAEALTLLRSARPGAQPLAAQRALLAGRAAPPTREAALIRASLTGGAIGDALGAEIEFWPLEKILRRFPRGVDEILPHQGRRGAITDDTQMTLFTAEGLIRAQVRGLDRGLCDPPGVVHHAYLRWLATQGESPRRMELCAEGLVADPRLRARRAPGLTCLGALRAAQSFGEKARNDSKGCGTIMRVAPAGLLGRWNPRRLGREISALTHGHEAGQEAAAVFAELLHRLMRGEALEPALRALLETTSGETKAAMAAALAAPRDGSPESVEALGGGWVAEEALAVALYAGLCARGFEEGLRIAVTHSGDSDSTGAVAGNLLGLLFPEEVMAHRWRREIECMDLILRLADDLAGAREGDEDWALALRSRYPGW